MDNNFKPSPSPSEIEANTYTEGRSLGSKGEEVISEGLPDAKSNLFFDGIASVLVTGTIQSKNYLAGVRGWKLSYDGTAEFNS